MVWGIKGIGDIRNKAQWRLIEKCQIIIVSLNEIK